MGAASRAGEPRCLRRHQTRTRSAPHGVRFGAARWADVAGGHRSYVLGTARRYLFALAKSQPRRATYTQVRVGGREWERDGAGGREKGGEREESRSSGSPVGYGLYVARNTAKGLTP
eukprot:6019285-Prymnesium_polylepis.1